MELGLSIYMSLSPKCNVPYIWSILIKRNSNMDGNRLKIRFDHYIIHKEKASHKSSPFPKSTHLSARSANNSPKNDFIILVNKL